MTRIIPRAGLRLLAFLLYSGSAGGIILSVLCITLTLLIDWNWRAFFHTHGMHAPVVEPKIGDFQRVFTALALYTFCYGMSAVLLRVYLLRERIRPVFTWALALLLLGLGCVLPWIAAILVHAENLQRRADLQWWLLSNPFVAIYEIGDGHHDDFVTACFVFLGGWALALVALSLAWTLQQIVQFRPTAIRAAGNTSAATEQQEEVALAAPVDAG